MSDLPKQTSPASNLNTIMLTILLGVVGFVAISSVDNGKDAAAIKASMVTRTDLELVKSQTDADIEKVKQSYVDILSRVVALERDSNKRQP